MLFALIGVKWTLVFILCSALVAALTGLIVEMMVKAGRLPANSNEVELPDGFKLLPEMKAAFRGSTINHSSVAKMLRTGLGESQMILRWIFFGTVLAAAIGIRPLLAESCRPAAVKTPCLYCSRTAENQHRGDRCYAHRMKIKS